MNVNPRGHNLDTRYELLILKINTHRGQDSRWVSFSSKSGNTSRPTLTIVQDRGNREGGLPRLQFRINPPSGRGWGNTYEIKYAPPRPGNVIPGYPVTKNLMQSLGNPLHSPRMGSFLPDSRPRECSNWLRYNRKKQCRYLSTPEKSCNFLLRSFPVC